MSVKPFDSTILADAAGALDYITNVLEASPEYSIIGKSLKGTTPRWNERVSAWRSGRFARGGSCLDGNRFENFLAVVTVPRLWRTSI